LEKNVTSADPLALYADLQTISDKLSRLSPYYWGLDSALEYLLEAIVAGTVPADHDELNAVVARKIASAARLNRSRAEALSYNAPIELPPTADDAAAEARVEIARVLRVVSSNDADVLIEAALGYTDREIAERRGSTPGAVRVRVSRLRLKIAA
jgi:DNA-binding NarL/FixJ family response regulator